MPKAPFINFILNDHKYMILYVGTTTSFGIIRKSTFTYCHNYYGKYPKILNTLFHTFLACFWLFVQLFLKILSGMANSVDPYQIAPSGSGSERLNVRHLGVQNFRTFTIPYQEL